MKHEIFKPEDFLRFEITDLANKKLNELIESWPVVYGDKDSPNPIWSKRTGATHTARIAFIEEIVKEPCRHEPDFSNRRYVSPKCRLCGVDLQATWSEK